MSNYAARRKVLAEIEVERVRQVNKEGWTPAHDDEHTDGALAKAAACYALCAGVGSATSAGREHHYRFTDEYSKCGVPAPTWPFEPAAWKPRNPRRDLIRAAALVVAEIERLDRAKAAP